MRTVQTLFYAVALMLVASSANAQAAANIDFTTAGPLAGLNNFAVVIEDVSDELQKCGVKKETLDTSLRFILGQSKINIVEVPGANATIGISVWGTSQCIVGVELNVDALAMVENTKKVSALSVWHKPSLGGSNTAGDQVEFLAKRFVNDWNVVNK